MRLRKNMKNKLMDIRDKILLRKRAVIESVNDFLKNICQVEHSRYRSVYNFLVNLLAAISAYSFLPLSRPFMVSTLRRFCLYLHNHFYQTHVKSVVK
jgi:hypothetical protein